MDARIDPLALLGLELGDAHVMRNAGGRVTDDVLRGLRLSVGDFGTSTIVLIEHTECAAGITDHDAALADDIDVIAATAELADVDVVGLVFDLMTEQLRSPRHHSGATPTKHGLATLEG
jgi:carbonic anhydrase